MHVISVDENRRKGLALGAASHLKKSGGKEIFSEAFLRIHRSLERRMRELLVVEKDEAERQKILQLIGNGDVQTTAFGSAPGSARRLRRTGFDCVVLDPLCPIWGLREFIQSLQSVLSQTKRLPQSSKVLPNWPRPEIASYLSG